MLWSTLSKKIFLKNSFGGNKCEAQVSQIRISPKSLEKTFPYLFWLLVAPGAPTPVTTSLYFLALSFSLSSSPCLRVLSYQNICLDFKVHSKSGMVSSWAVSRRPHSESFANHDLGWTLFSTGYLTHFTVSQKVAKSGKRSSSSVFLSGKFSLSYKVACILTFVLFH